MKLDAVALDLSCAEALAQLLGAPPLRSLSLSGNKLNEAALQRVVEHEFGGHIVVRGTDLELQGSPHTAAQVGKSYRPVFAINHNQQREIVFLGPVPAMEDLGFIKRLHAVDHPSRTPVGKPPRQKRFSRARWAV